MFFSTCTPHHLTPTHRAPTHLEVGAGSRVATLRCGRLLLCTLLVGSWSPAQAASAQSTAQEKAAQSEGPKKQASSNNEEEQARDPLPTLQSDQVVSVRAATIRGEEDPETLQPVQVLNAKELMHRAIANTPQALEDATGVYVQRTNLGGGSPYIRGVTGQRILLMQDGVRQNDAMFRSGPNQYLSSIDPFLIDQIEIIRGPASVLYGSDAVGGVVNVRLKQPTLGADPGQTLRGEADFQTSTNTREASGHLRLELQRGGVAVLAAASNSDFNNFISATGVIPYTGYQSHAFTLRGRAVGSKGSLGVSWTSNHQLNVPRTDKCPSAATLALPASERPPFDCRFWDEQFRDQIVATMSSTWGRLELVQLKLYHRRTHELRQRFRSTKGVREDELDEVSTPGLSLDAWLKVFPGQPALQLGFDLSSDTLRSSGSTQDLASGVLMKRTRGRLANDAHRDNAGLFALWRHETLDWLGLWGGLRLALVRTRFQDPSFGDINTHPLALIGSTGVQLFPGKALQFLFDYAQAFRAPNVDDLSALGEFGGGYDVPNSALAPERSDSIEGSVRLRWRELRLELAGYFTLLRGAIERQPATYQGQPTLEIGGEQLQIFSRQNLGRARIMGLEGSAHLHHGPFFATLQAALARGEDLGSAEPLSRVPPAFARGSLGWQGGNSAMRVELFVRGAGAATRLAERDLHDRRICPGGPEGCQGTPGYLIFGLRAGLALGLGLRLDLQLQNLLNQSYRIHGSGIDGPGLGASLRLGWHLPEGRAEGPQGAPAAPAAADKRSL